MSVADAAQITSARVRTVNRRRRSDQIPAAALRLLQLHDAGLVVPDFWCNAPAGFTPFGTFGIRLMPAKIGRAY